MSYLLMRAWGLPQSDETRANYLNTYRTGTKRKVYNIFYNIVDANREKSGNAAVIEGFLPIKLDARNISFLYSRYILSQSLVQSIALHIRSQHQFTAHFISRIHLQ